MDKFIILCAVVLGHGEFAETAGSITSTPTKGRNGGKCPLPESMVKVIGLQVHTACSFIINVKSLGTLA